MQPEGESVVGRAVALVLIHVRRLRVARRLPAVERVPHSDDLLEGDVLHFDRADDGVVAQHDVLERHEAGLESLPEGEVVGGGLGEVEDEGRPLGRCRRRALTQGREHLGPYSRGSVRRLGHDAHTDQRHAEIVGERHLLFPHAVPSAGPRRSGSGPRRGDAQLVEGCRGRTASRRQLLGSRIPVVRPGDRREGRLRLGDDRLDVSVRPRLASVQSKVIPEREAEVDSGRTGRQQVGGEVDRHLQRRLGVGTLAASIEAAGLCCSRDPLHVQHNDFRRLGIDGREATTRRLVGID